MISLPYYYIYNIENKKNFEKKFSFLKEFTYIFIKIYYILITNFIYIDTRIVPVSSMKYSES